MGYEARGMKYLKTWWVEELSLEEVLVLALDILRERERNERQQRGGD